MDATYNCSGGVLLIVSPLQKLRIRWGERPLAEESYGEGKWRECAPDLRLLYPPHSPNAGLEALTDFRQTIAPDIAKSVEPFSSHQWNMMLFLRDSKEARDLAVSNPVLAYALANNAEVRGVSDRVTFYFAARNVRRRQRSICEALGFPGTEAFVRLLRKIPPETCSPSMLRVLQKTVRRDPAILTCLGHLQKITPGIVYLAGNEDVSRLVTPKLLAEAAGAPDDTMAETVAEQLFKILSCANRIEPAPTIPKLQSARAVGNLHECLALEVAAAQARALQAQEQEIARARARRAAALERKRTASVRIFPPPPFPGNDDIVPISNEADLKMESTRQNNCVQSYAPKIATSGPYIYRVLSPERATLAIAKTRRGWVIEQIKASRNRDVRPGTLETVQRWLLRVQRVAGMKKMRET